MTASLLPRGPPASDLCGFMHALSVLPACCPLSLPSVHAGKDEPEQLHKIFELLGAPNERIWPGVTALPHVAAGQTNTQTTTPQQHGRVDHAAAACARAHGPCQGKLPASHSSAHDGVLQAACLSARTSTRTTTCLPASRSSPPPAHGASTSSPACSPTTPPSASPPGTDTTHPLAG